MSAVGSTQNSQTQLGAGVLQYRSAMIDVRVGAAVSAVGLGAVATTSYPITGAIVALGGVAFAGRGVWSANRAVDAMVDAVVQLFVIRPIVEVGRVFFGIR